MFDFFKRKNIQVKEPRKIYIPEDRIEDVLRAWDEYAAAPRPADTLLRYKFWKLAAEVCPETTDGKWAPVLKNGCQPFFIEEDDLGN